MISDHAKEESELKPQFWEDASLFASPSERLINTGLEWSVRIWAGFDLMCASRLSHFVFLLLYFFPQNFNFKANINILIKYSLKKYENYLLDIFQEKKNWRPHSKYFTKKNFEKEK